MKKKIIIFICLFFAFSYNVKAVCEDTELNDWLETLEIKLSIVENNEYPYSYLLMLSDSRKDLIVKAKDTYSTNIYNVEYDNEFNNYVVGSEIHFIDKEYTFYIYMSNESDTCKNELVKTINYTVASFNQYSDTVYCENNPSDESCGLYADVDKNDEMDKKVNDYYEEYIEKIDAGNKGILYKILYYLKEYYLYVLVPALVVSTVYLILIKKNKKRGEE